MLTRLHPPRLQGGSSPPAADVKFILVVDNPDLPPSLRHWIRTLQHRLLHRLRVRVHAVNLGASAARNRCLDESLADFIVFFDDDVVPAEGCLDAYVRAFLDHPEVCQQVAASLTHSCHHNPGVNWLLTPGASSGASLLWWDR
jgi:glycosyltransferase involved in cell wall biosynthesis